MTTTTLAPAAEQPTISAVGAEPARVAVAPPPVAATRGPALLEIIVSLDDIRDGVQGISDTCAVAVALRRVGHRDVRVQHDWVHADGVDYQPTAELREWIKAFDGNRRWVHPVRWVLRPRDQGGAA